MTFNFGDVLTRAWEITWKYKVLWIFGILVSCSQGNGGGGGGGGNVPSGGPSGSPSDFDVPPEIQRIFHQFRNFDDWLAENLWVFVVFGLFVLVLVILSVFLGTIGRIGLIKGSYEAELGAISLNFGELFSSSVPYFWRVFGLSFLIGLAFLVILIPIILIGVLSAGVGFLCLLPLICILIPVGIAVGIILEQANRAIVLEDMGIVDGFKRGWEIAKANVWTLIIMALILFGIILVLGVVIALPVFIIVFPAFFSFLMSEGQSFRPLYIATICFCLYLPVSLVLNGIVTTFSQSAWTLTFMRLTQETETSEAPADNVEPDA